MNLKDLLLNFNTCLENGYYPDRNEYIYSESGF